MTPNPAPAPSFQDSARLAAADAVITLLDYSVSTSPRPLQISTTGTVLIVASNPGGYSDRPEQDYVAVESIVFDFGLKGSGGSNLTNTDGSSWGVTSPAGWAAPVVSGLKFTFTPPPGKERIFPAAGLQFTFAQIPVNATVGTAILTLGETASSPGNPAEPDFYPPQPRVLRERKRPLGKFPVDFSVGDLTAQPPNVPVGGATVLSWSGSAGAAYEISYGPVRVTKHANGTLLQPIDIYPNSAAGDAPLTLRNRTVYTLTVTYAPDAGTDPAIFQRQATVSVYHAEPVIELFTATPEFIQVPSGSPAVITLSWDVKNGRKPDCVAFTVTPPLPTYPATGKGLQHSIKYSQPITLTAYGEEGTTPVSQTKYILVGRTATITAGIGEYSGFVTVSPDGKYAFVANQSSRSLSVISTSGTDIAAWKTIATLGGFPPNPSSVAYAASSAGQFVLVPTADNNGGLLTVFTVNSTDPTKWPRVTLKTGLGLNAVHVTTSPDGNYAFVTCTGPHSFPGPKSCVSVLTINNANPQQWPVYNIESNDQQLIMLNTRVSPRGEFACITVKVNFGGPDQLWVVALRGPAPAQWPIVARLNPGLGSGTRGLAFSPDRKLGLVPNFNGHSVQVLDVSSDDPNRWRVIGSVTKDIRGPVTAAFSADGTYAFVTNISDNFVTILGVTAEPPEKWNAQRLTQGIGNRPNEVVTAKTGTIAFVANDNGYKPGSLTIVALEPSIDLAQARVVTPAKFRARRR